MQRRWLLALGLVVMVCSLTGRAAAQTEEAWHFESDATRHARVDDRGGLGEGYSFSVDYDATDGNSEDFCPHCRLTLLVSDPGLDLAELERVGVSRSTLSSATSLVTTLQSVAAADPTGLAMMVAPGITSPDLELLIAEIRRIQGEIGIVVTALETFATLAGTGFDWETASVDALIEALSLRMDTAFLGDFSDPNDPRIHNSGVDVYSVPELISGLSSTGVPMSVTSAISSTLSAIPGVPGSLEISGDDDDVLSPASYHGYHTDLTVRQRTYVVNGVSAYLIVYTIVNETSRVFPFVEASMMADFDIPPLSYDTSTEFDPATQSVMLYDTIPYTDPEQHYWFGVAPARMGTAGPGVFSFANYNIDDSFTLAQMGSSTTQEYRYRYLLWDPSLSGDQDSAMGKSEKQGAVTMVLGGPLLPGDARTVAFCYAAGEGGSSAAARTAMLATMTACRAIYGAIDPVCGDSTRAYPEECDPPNGTTCNALCQTVACGDGRLDAPEQCDDGNLDPGDGCDASCVREECGNGIAQAGEDCDDGNASSLDACLPDCTLPRCGDGIVRAGTGCTGTDCGCAGYAHCLTGSFTVGTVPRTSAFVSLAGRAIDFRVGFDVASTDTRGIAVDDGVRITTGPVHFEMTGGTAAPAIAAAFEGQSWELDLRATPHLNPAFTTSRIEGTARIGRTTVPVGFTLAAATRTDASFSVDRGGVPVLSTLRINTGTAQLVVVPASGSPTDVVMAGCRGAIGTVPAGDAGELCDDGNASDFDLCTSACVPAACGDGIVQVANGEECDEGPSPPAWCTDCHRTGTSCGNGTLEAAFGEECDDSNTTDGDGCSAICRTERCGDGVVQAGEDCDDGGNGDGDGCTDACVLERCGDGVMQPREGCDEGAANADDAACLSDCTPASCGDGHVLDGTEGCDDGNLDVGDGCNATCVVERCGDGAPGPDEECDDGNMVEGDGCAPDCVREICGDGRPGPSEQCDDGNVVDGDGCDKDCALENLAACGDGLVGTGEQCDDGARSDGDGCDQYCQLEDPAACGNGREDPGESCDDGNTMAGDGCSATCTIERCGDGVQARGEQCDDGNEMDGDGCAADCTVEPSLCGNGVHELGEQCDGEPECGADCTTDGGDLSATCGNGELDLGEECDDGGRLDGNGCDGTCQIEATVCGNGRLERGETCDDGNMAAGDGCSPTCNDPVPPPPTPPTGGCGGCATAREPREGLALVLLLISGLVLARRRRARA
ncbi:MAG: DUF4215 domain-containing protein [Sandaracinaceae bacterium]|nr:DUF4215 domain-containing protein [Sandaracinaceae bacterium]